MYRCTRCLHNPALKLLYWVMYASKCTMELFYQKKVIKKVSMVLTRQALFQAFSAILLKVSNVFYDFIYSHSEQLVKAQIILFHDRFSTAIASDTSQDG